MPEKTKSAPFRRGEWLFYMEYLGPMFAQRFMRRELDVDMIEMSFDVIYCIKHEKSGLLFRFSDYDAICKWYQEKHPGVKHGIDLPTYLSPFSPSLGYDSAYIGNIMLQKPGKDPVKADLPWEDVGFFGLREQIVWTDKFNLVSGMDPLRNFPMLDAQGNLPRVFNRRHVWVPKGMLLRPALINFTAPLIMDDGFTRPRDFACNFSLVVADNGWFVSLTQEFFNHQGAKRVREMTMNCKFEDNIVYREIIERQTKNFNIRLDFPREKDLLPKANDEMCLYYHEAKQLRVKEVCHEVYSSQRVLGTRTSNLFSMKEEELNDVVLEAVNVCDDKVLSLFDGFGKQIEVIKAETNTDIQIIPFFHQPKAYKKKISGIEPRRAYIYGYLKDDVDRAKDRLLG